MLQKSFTDRMKHLLGESYGAFEDALGREPVRGARVNKIKCATEDFLRICDYPLRAISYIDNGFIVENSDGIGCGLPGDCLHHG